MKKRQDSAEAGSDKTMIKKVQEQQMQGLSDSQSRKRNSSKHSMNSNSDINEPMPLQAIDRYGDSIDKNKQNSTNNR